MLATNIREAFANILGSKMRSFLALLGILVGTASVVAMVSCGTLATEAALAQFKDLGTGLMSVAINPKSQKQHIYLELFNEKKALGLKSASTSITAVAPYTSSYLPVEYHGKSINATIIGVTKSLSKVIKIQTKKGRFISNLDNYSYYCYVGEGIYKKMSRIAGQDVIGKQVRIGPNIFTIVGVAKKWPENSFFYQDINYSILVPIKTSRILSKYSLINNIVFYLEPNADIEAVKKKTNAYLNKAVPGMTFFYRSAEQIIKSMQKQSKIFTMLLGLIGSISLIVGGIGVMNIMLVSVVERKREIGIRKALGARRRDIQSLFLIESITLSVIGGLVGVGVGVLTSYIIAKFAKWTFIFLISPSLVGFCVSVGIGIFFGFYPAWKASRLDPIDSLRVD